MNILLNIDVPDVQRAERFYCAAFGLYPARRLGEGIVELVGGSVLIYLLQKAEMTMPAPASVNARTYERHWSPVHFDVVVEDIETAISKMRVAGALQEGETVVTSWSRLARFADPFGHGFCLIEFVGRGYDEIAT